MNKRLIVFLSITLLLSSCFKHKIAKDVPRCIKTKIVKFDESEACEGAHVDEYTFQGGAVFLFNVGYCGSSDISAEVVDSKGKAIGFLWGLAGNNIINGESFYKATFVRTVWKKES